MYSTFIDDYIPHFLPSLEVRKKRSESLKAAISKEIKKRESKSRLRKKDSSRA